MARNVRFDIEKNAFPAESKNATSNTFILFEARAAYEDVTLDYIRSNSPYVIPFSDLYKNNALYGCIDLEGDAIQPVDIEDNFKFFGNDGLKENKVQDFVADAFLSMKLFLNNAFLKQRVEQSTVYKNLQLFSRYDNIDNLYKNHHYILAQNFKNISIANNVNNAKIKDHKTFISEYIKYLKSLTNNFPITKSQSIIFFNFFIFPSGLVFDVAKDTADNDEIKFRKYFTDQGFNIFSEACLRYGFNIDKNIPWRLYANLNSPALLPYMQRYGLTNINEVFATRYKKVFFSDLEELKALFFRSYVLFISNNLTYEPSYKELYGNNTKYFERKLISYNEFIEDYPDQFWIRLYAYFKNYETNKNLTQVQFDNMVRETNELVKLNKTVSALKYLNNYFKDYNLVREFALQNINPELQSDAVSNNTSNNIIF